MRELSSPVRRALDRALDHGFFGGISLDLQIDHAQAFGTCAEAVLEKVWGPGALRDPGSLTSGGEVVAPHHFLDLGSGGGLPGLVLADRWKSSQAVLLESNVRRARALDEAVRECGWEGRVSVVDLRAEVAGRSELRGSFDLVVARSFGPPPVTAECAAPFLRIGGLLVVSEPPADLPSAEGLLPPAGFLSEGDQGRWPREGLAALGLEPTSTWRDRFGFQVLRQVAWCPDRFPRREGVPRKRPLYPVQRGDRSLL